MTRPPRRSAFGAFFVVAAAATCGAPAARAPDQGVPDLGAPTSDLAGPAVDFAPPPRGAGRIGDPCQSDGDCGEGLHPVCFVAQVAGFAPAATPGGYCSAPCSETPYDCGSALCMWFGFDRPYCFRPCGAAADCRSGYACLAWMAQVCFPAAPFLDCDPTSGDGSCTTAGGQPGGCYRLALGGGLAGRCGARCDIGVGHCAPDPSGAPQRCRPVNDRLDVDGGATADRFAGTICDLQSSSARTGGACVYGWTNPPQNFASACADAYDCAAKFDPFGDEDCHPLCFLDGGAPAGDGGTEACATDGGCQDVYRLAGSADPRARVGLCMP